MSSLVIPQGYTAPLPNYELQRAIAFIKESFQSNLANALNLRRVSAPLFVASSSSIFPVWERTVRWSTLLPSGSALH